MKLNLPLLPFTKPFLKYKLLFLTGLLPGYFSFSQAIENKPGIVKNITPSANENSQIDPPEIKQLQADISRLKIEITDRLKKSSNGDSIALHNETNPALSLLNFLNDSIKTDAENDSTKLLEIKKQNRWRLFLEGLLSAIVSGDIKPADVEKAFRSYTKIAGLTEKNISIFPAIKENSLALQRVILQAIKEEKNIGSQESIDHLARQTFIQKPQDIFKILFRFPSASCADSLLPIAARKLPEELYIYSQARNSPLGKKIHGSSNELVKLIADLSDLPQGRLYFPFLDDLYHKKISLADIDKTLGEGKQVPYYQLLIKTLIGYNKRLSSGDTAIAMQTLLERIALNAYNDFVKTINMLHEFNDKVRLKVLEKLNAQELYYLCINGVNDLFTSSYLKIYKSIFNGQPSLNSYALLNSVQFDHFRRFIKLAGVYNTLDDFLGRMKKKEASELMHGFIDNLNEKATLEDAVDVANSYASIRNESLRRLIAGEIQIKRNIEQKDGTNGTGIYTMLNTLFLSFDTANHIDLSKALGVPDLYRISNGYLKDDSGRIIIQHFFYGDDDGKYAFDIFLRSLHNGGWKLTTKKYWVEAISLKNASVRIYANMPLDDNTNQSEYAQKMLGDHLSKNNIVPSVIIHRGHSYHANTTINQLTGNSKLIIIGSCGGFTQLSHIYSFSPLAQIITTKQQGSITINQPMISYITDLLVQGKNLDWPDTWKVLGARFKANPFFEDYIPPYQNLGAILIMACKQ